MSTKRTSDVAQLEAFIKGISTTKREALIARQSPEDQEAIRQALGGEQAGGSPTVEEEKIAPPPPLVELNAPAPRNAQQAVEGLDAAAKAKKLKEQQAVFRAEVAGRVAERRREEAALTAADRFAAKAFGLGNGVFQGGKGWLESKPTPGGIGVPLGILLFFFFLLIPVNGHTRLMWLWLTITGNAQIGGPLPPPTLTPQAPPVTSTSPNNIVSAVTGFETALWDVLNPGAAIAQGAQQIGQQINKLPSINPTQSTTANQGKKVTHPVSHGSTKGFSTGPPNSGGGPPVHTNLNGHAHSYGSLMQSMEE